MFMRRCLLRSSANHSGRVVRVGGISGLVGPYMVRVVSSSFRQRWYGRKNEVNGGILG